MSRRRRGLVIALLLALVTASTLLYAGSRLRVARASLEVGERLREEREARRENQRLRIALERKMTPARLEQAASQRLDLAAPSENQVVILEEEGSK
jgi:cell division protein FtsL